VLPNDLQISCRPSGLLFTNQRFRCLPTRSAVSTRDSGLLRPVGCICGLGGTRPALSASDAGAQLREDLGRPVGRRLAPRAELDEPQPQARMDVEKARETALGTGRLSLQ
jgi:hypothetical protein